jgi:nucleoid-associated protein YgaU
MKKVLALVLLILLLGVVTGCPKRPLVPPVDQARLDAEEAIASASKAIDAAWEVGADTSIAESLLEEARSAFAAGDYATATSKAWEAEAAANAAREEALAKAKEEEKVAEEVAVEEVAEEAARIYVVGTWQRDRDCLWNIAKKPRFYGDPWKWKRIYKANTDKIKDPDLIYPGQKLLVP